MELIDRFNSIFLRTYTFRILDNFLDLAVTLLPYLAAGILVVALLQRYVTRLQRLPILQSDKPLNIMAAALAGVLAPLPVYVAVPFSAVLIANGLPAAVVLAFLVACPLIDPNLFLLTYGAFGIELALARVIVAFVLATSAGLLYGKIARLVPLAPADSLAGSAGQQAERSLGRPFLVSLRRQSMFILKIFSVSILISAAIKALAPPEYVRMLLGGEGYAAILVAIALGVPFYHCGGAAIPLMEALRELGMSSGAVLAFFISGPATKISALYAFGEGYGARFVALFLAFSLSGAFAAGLLFNLFF